MSYKVSSQCYNKVTSLLSKCHIQCYLKVTLRSSNGQSKGLLRSNLGFLKVTSISSEGHSQGHQKVTVMVLRLQNRLYPEDHHVLVCRRDLSGETTVMTYI